MRAQVSPKWQDEERVPASPRRRGDAHPGVRALLALQSSAGNAATAKLIAARRSPLPHAWSLQRGGDDESSSDESSDEERQARDHVKEQMGKVGTPGTPPAPVTEQDLASADTIVDADARRKGSRGQAAATKQQLRELAEEYGEQREFLVKVAHGEGAPGLAPTGEDSGSDPEVFVDRRRSGQSGRRGRGRGPQASGTGKAEEPEVSEGAAVDQAMVTQQSARGLLDISMRLGAAAPPGAPDDLDAATSQLEEQPKLLGTLIDTADTLFGPGPEATPSALGGAPAAVLGPLTSTDPGGLGIEGPAADAGGFFGGYAGTQDFLGNLARIATGIVTFLQGWRGHDGVHRLTSKDSRHGLGEIARGCGGAFVSLFGLVKSGVEATGGAVSTALNAVAGAAGVVLGTVSAVLTSRKAWRARVRKEAARLWQLRGETATGLAPKKATERADRQDWRFWDRLRAAAQLLKRKAARKEARKAVGATGAGVGAVGGLVLFLVVVGAISAANIWNPVGWVLGGVAAGVGIGLGIYRLWRRVKRAKHRREQLKQAPSFWTGATRQSRVRPEKSSDYARFVVTELKCSQTRKHLHAKSAHGKAADGHEPTMEDFVREVLRKDPDKVRTRGERSIAGKWTTW